MNKSSPTYIFIFMTAVCIIFGTGVASVHYATRGMLERNATLHRNRVISRAFGLHVEGTAPDDYRRAIAGALTYETIDAPDSMPPFEVFRHKETTGENIGFIFSGLGFWDTIQGILVLSPDLQNIVNIQFLDHKETPGLGARIEEPSFTDQFRDLSVDWQAPADRRIIVGPSSGSRQNNRVDAITGATQTSLSLMKLLNKELQRFKTVYEPHR